MKSTSSGDSRLNYKQIILAIIALLWITVVAGFYYIGHKPFSQSLALNITGALWQFIVALFVILICGAIGLKLIRPYCQQTIIRIVLPVALGVGILSIVFLVLGSFIGLNRWIGWLLLLFTTIIFRRDLIEWLSYWKDLAIIWESVGWQSKSFLIGILIIISTTLIVSIVPPLKFDALVYHLTLPKIFLEAGRFIYVPDIMYWGMPLLGEMIYTLSYSLAGVETATVTGWLIGLLSLIGLAGYSMKIFNNKTAWIVLASLLIGSTASLSLSWGYIDWIGFLFGLCVLISLDNWRIGENRSDLILAGICTGFALGVKYTSGIVLLSGVVVVVYSSIKIRSNIKKSLLNLLVYITLSIIVASPWCIKNLIFTGNPFYPFFFPSGAMSEFRQYLYTLPPVGSIWDTLLLPLRATLFGFEGAPGYSASIGPLFLGLGLLSWIGWNKLNSRQKVSITTSILIGVSSLIVWMIASQFSEYLIQSRIYFAIFPAFAVLAGAGFNSLGTIHLSGIRIQKVVGIFILVLFWFSVVDVIVASFSKGGLQVILDLKNEEEYLEDNLGWYAPSVLSMNDLPENSRVIMLWEPRGYYCIPKCDPDEILDRWLFELHQNGTPDATLDHWRQAGYTHLLYNRFGADFVQQNDSRYIQDDWGALDHLLNILPEPVSFGDNYFLYRLRP